MGKLHSKGLPVFGERERTELFVGPQQKQRISKADDCSFPGQTQTIGTASTERHCQAIYQPPESSDSAPVNFFFFHFFRSRYEILLSIEFFFLIDLDLIHFCFRFQGFLSKCLQIFAFVLRKKRIVSQFLSKILPSFSNFLIKNASNESLFFL